MITLAVLTDDSNRRSLLDNFVSENGAQGGAGGAGGSGNTGEIYTGGKDSTVKDSSVNVGNGGNGGDALSSELLVMHLRCCMTLHDCSHCLYAHLLGLCCVLCGCLWSKH